MVLPRSSAAVLSGRERPPARIDPTRPAEYREETGRRRPTARPDDGRTSSERTRVSGLSSPLPPGDDALVHHIADIASVLTADRQPIAPESVVGLARVAVPSTQAAGLTLIRADRPPTTVASTGTGPPAVDLLQYELHEGPCLDAADGPSVTLSPDVSRDPRWPSFGRRCEASTGVRSVLALRLPLGGEDRAALSFYSTAVDAFSPDDVVAASVLAPLAALVLEAHLRRSDVGNLHAALESSRTIGMAVGILMASHRVGREEAFALLRTASMALNAKLRDVAAEVADTGELPGSSPRRVRG